MKKLLVVSVAFIMLFGYAVVNANSGSKTFVIPHELAPMNRDAIAYKLVQDGKLSANATQEEVNKALKDYMGNIVIKEEVTQYTKKRDAELNAKVDEGLKNAKSNVKDNNKNKGKTLDPLSPTPYGEPVKVAKVLVVLVEYADFKHNTELQSSPTSYWTEDSSVEHYRQLIFNENGYTTPEGIESHSMKSYFREQSNGNFDIDGDVVGWYEVSQSAKYYGEDIGGRGNDNAPRELVEEVMRKVAVDVDLGEFDSDGDGVVDHLMIIHAGVGQEEGGASLGTDAIWSHSWNLPEPTVVTPEGADEYSVFDYTIEPENGAIGVMVHEFTHDLGIPDDYDTAYTGDGDFVEYWSLMASGSWTGEVGGTKPTGINPYSRIILGLIHGGDWINWGGASLGGPQFEVNLATASMNTDRLQSVLFFLPSLETVVAVPTEGSNAFYGGKAAEIDHNMTLQLDLTNVQNASLTYDVWYNIEEAWDAGFIQVSEDGTNFVSLQTPYTVTFENPSGYPTIMDSLPGYTGNSHGWLKEDIDLSGYAGKEIYVRFRYATDWGTETEGMFVDNVKVVADGVEVVSEGAEEGFGQFVNSDFEISTGVATASHYYVAEWRSHLGVDEGLKYCARANVEYNQGLVLWYKNNSYDNNWVGAHPGYGQLAVVDAGQFVYLNSGLGNGNEYGSRAGYMPFVQLHDAAFSLDKASDMDLSIYSWAKNSNLHGKQAQPVFDDSNSYFNEKSPYSGVYLNQYGLKIEVTANADDYSIGSIKVTR